MTTELIQLYDTVSEKIGKEGAAALASYLSKFTDERVKANIDNLVTKTEFHKEIAEIRMDIAELRSELKQDVAELHTEITELRSELKQDIAELRSEFKQDIAELRSEYKQDIAELRTEIVALRADLQNEMKDGFAKMNRIFIQWLIGFFTSLVILILTLYFNR
ncbi:coiled-coil domain-containing protein [Capnocytophaga sp. oral taxon 864]|uniref:coiled-coil domain-containing protein n=1 Tax=Capnocytophaga sp. oral taxon 864 TaxID=1316593 RepID=UPI000D038D5B|nr:coiled-coil domain-containing protein [Capnocytophaga sp. oral taxon 864]AVM55918.1 hypothetical protein C3V44_10050 [Capnocytophaga sp. oral taxon 864]